MIEVKSVNGEPVRITMGDLVNLVTAEERRWQTIRYIENEEYPDTRIIYGILTGGDYPAKEETHYGESISR